MDGPNFFKDCPCLLVALSFTEKVYIKSESLSDSLSDGVYIYIKFKGK